LLPWKPAAIGTEIGQSAIGAMSECRAVRPIHADRISTSAAAVQPTHKAACNAMEATQPWAGTAVSSAPCLRLPDLDTLSRLLPGRERRDVNTVADIALVTLDRLDTERWTILARRSAKKAQKMVIKINRIRAIVVPVLAIAASPT
jgi:hypothetical protein